jgi:hypothetical protein
LFLNKVFDAIYKDILGVFTVRFGSVFIKNSNQTKIFFFLKNRTETGSNRPVSVRFGFLEKKPVQTGLARFFRFGSVLARFWLGLTRFFRFGSVFSVWLGFFGLARFWHGFFPVFFSVRFGFSGSRLKKPKPNRTGRFF